MKYKLFKLMIVILLAGMFASCVDSSSSVDAGSSDGDVTTIDGDSSEILPDGDQMAGGLVSIELIPPSESGYPAQQFIDVELSNFQGELKLEKAAIYTGEVRDPEGMGVEATLTLVRAEGRNMIAGRPLPNISIQTNEMDEKDSKSEFQLALLPGLYSLYLFPGADSILPPYVRNNDLLIEHDIYEVFWLERGLSVSGVIRNADGKTMPFVKVTAYSDGQWMRSSVAISDIYGEFTIHLSTKSESYNIVLDKSEQDQFLPNTIIQSAFEVKNNQVELILPVDSKGRLILAYEEFEKKVCLISGKIKDYQGNLVPNSKLVFSNAYVGGGSYVKKTNCDENGNYEAELLYTNAQLANNYYKLTVFPPIDSDLATNYASNIDCVQESVSLDVALTKRLVVQGVISNADGEPIELVQVQVQKKPVQIEPNEYDTNVYLKTVQTDIDGKYMIAIDSGTHDFTFIPPPESGLGRTFLNDAQISTDTTWDQQLKYGQVFSGKVVNEDGDPLAWVYLEVFRTRVSGNKDDSGQSDIIGSGSSDENGMFEIIIP